MQGSVRNPRWNLATSGLAAYCVLSVFIWSSAIIKLGPNSVGPFLRLEYLRADLKALVDQALSVPSSDNDDR